MIVWELPVPGQYWNSRSIFSYCNKYIMSCLDGRTVAGCSWHSGDIQRPCKPFTAGLLLWATTPHASLQNAFSKVVSTCFQYLSCFSMLIFTSLLSKCGQKMPKPPTLPFCTASCPPSKCSSPKLDQHFQHWKESNLITSSFPSLLSHLRQDLSGSIQLVSPCSKLSIRLPSLAHIKI